MKKLSVTSPIKWLISGAFILLLALVALPRAEVLSAHPPVQEGAQPDFVSVGQSSPDGGVTIQSQEARLDAAFMAANGQLDGLEVTPAGLSLAAGLDEGAYTSGVIYSPLAFTTDIVPLWGGDFPAESYLRFETRLSLDGGNSWSDWLNNPEAFYPVRDDLHSGNLIWVGGDQAALQFRVTFQADSPDLSPVLAQVVLVFNDTSQGPTDGEIAGQMAGISSSADVCPVEKPPVVSRVGWGCPDGQDSPRRPPVYRPVTHIIIHQSETPNQVGPYQDWAGWVRSVWNFHANVLWWGDVGYNYLIDPNGVIYEGRAGGDDVVGIHDGRNLGSLAIGFLGCYGNCDDPRLSVAEPDQAMLDSAVQLMAWKLGEQGIDPLSAADYNGLNDIPVIAGGRDVAWTSSPGDNLYNQLPNLRADVADEVACLQACEINSVIFDRESYDVGDTIHLTVRLTDYRGTPLSGANVTADVTHEPLAAQASTGFGLIDRAGEYDGVYDETNEPGNYQFNITAVDPTGERFLLCTITKTVQVDGDSLPTSTPTPTTTPTTTPETPTPTPTPTDTPTPTPTVEPDETTLRVEPETLTLCQASDSGEVNVENVEGMSAVQLVVTYDPAVVQVIDADDSREGVQVSVGDAFASGFIAQNEVDPAVGRISFAATLFGGDRIDGDANLLSIDWQPQDVGTSAITLEDIILVDAFGQELEFTPVDGTIEVISDCATITGWVALQGRDNYDNVQVTSSTGEQTQTAADGSFSIASGGLLRFEFPGYLSAQTDLGAALESAQSATLGTITLLAGDVNRDDLVNILDLAYIAKNYRSTDPLADLNGDGRVDIRDLALAAGNYQQQGPLTAWQ